MKHEGMPTQRLEGKRVEECVGEGERERGRERERVREHTQAEEKERERGLWLLLLYVFSSTWACLCKLGLARSTVCST